MPVLKSLEPRKLRLKVFAVAGCANELLSVGFRHSDNSGQGTGSLIKMDIF